MKLELLKVKLINVSPWWFVIKNFSTWNSTSSSFVLMKVSMIPSCATANLFLKDLSEL